DPSLDENGNSLQTSGLKLKYFKQLPGSCFAAGGWIGCSVAFTLRVNWGYGITLYGAMTFLVLSMLWMYCCMYLLLVGAYINHVWTGMADKAVEKHKEKRMADKAVEKHKEKIMADKGMDK
ncbi:MAG: YihY/virulence factor BrkB family protein, partial [Lachnospiraceae bacterium]|nr:YihY/virulence factor BrkB family protein [Lachnospiraceae bacterium]